MKLDILNGQILEEQKETDEFSNVHNLVYKKDGKVIKNEMRNLIANLDEIPLTDKDLFYDAIPFSKNTYTIMTSRGCPFSCTYCFNNYFNKLYKGKGKYLRKRGIDSVMQELKEAKEKYDFKFVSILDDVFMTDDKWIEEFCERYKKEIKIPFRCLGHVNCVNEENIKNLKEAGCEIIQIGIQTTSEETRRKITHRFETNQRIRDASAIIKKNKIKLEVDHILGMPHETEEHQVEAAKFYNEIRPDIINVYWLKCFPKTDIIDYMVEDGRIAKEDVEKINNGISPSYVLGGDVHNAKDLNKYHSLLNMIPVLPKSTIDFIIKHKLYRLTNFGNKFMIMLRAIHSVAFRDIRLLEFVSFYKHYMLKKMFSKEEKDNRLEEVSTVKTPRMQFTAPEIRE